MSWRTGLFHHKATEYDAICKQLEQFSVRIKEWHGNTPFPHFLVGDVKGDQVHVDWLGKEYILRASIEREAERGKGTQVFGLFPLDQQGKELKLLRYIIADTLGNLYYLDAYGKQEYLGSLAVAEEPIERVLQYLFYGEC